MINKPEYWRINLAVEKVIIRHEFEILEKQLSDLVKDNWLIAPYAAGHFAAFAQSVGQRVNNIINSGNKERKSIVEYDQVKGRIFMVDSVKKNYLFDPEMIMQAVAILRDPD